ncbi:hypothetical protein MNBD_DELTA01-1138 [hydrothermal vent metagenome]|uniref:GGDEF domain-containing protein n=1 Tax=hydrothermal vent metagenome TaxID=652676 RepID=A0A3B0QWG4_9ZZZZ
MATKTKKIDATLSPVERKILRCIKQGMTNEEIGEVIGKSKWTVKFHLGKVMKKLGVRTRVQAVSYAMGQGAIASSAPTGSGDFLVSKPLKVFRAGMVGCGEKGEVLLGLLKDKAALKVEWVVESETDAPCLELAKEMGVRVLTALDEVVSEPLDMIIDLSGSKEVRERILALKNPETELLSGLPTRLMWLVGHQHAKNSKDDKKNVSAANKCMIEGLGKIAGNIHGVKDLASAIVEQAIRLTGSSAGLLAVCDEPRENMTLVAASGYSRRLTEVRSWKISHDGITTMAIDRDTPLLIPDLSEYPASSPVLEREGVRTLMVAPLTVGGKLVGMLQVSDINHGTYSQGELSLFTLLNVYAGRFLNKARVVEEAQLTGVRDALTGLFDRSYILEQLRLEICRASRHEGNLALLVINIDGFRMLLKTHGALEVNRFLRVVGGYLKRNLRETDIVARMHDGEFCILIPELETAEGVKFLSERIVEELTALPVLKGGVSFKVGIALYPEDGLVKGELIKKVGTAARYRKDTLSRKYFKPTRPERPASL